MARDYAKYKLHSKQKRAKKNWHRQGAVIILMACMIAVMFVVFAFYKSTKGGTLTAWVAEIKSYLSHKKIQTASLIKNSPAVQIKQEPEVHFNFYTELPKTQVTLSETDKTPSQSVSAPQQELLVSQKQVPLSNEETKNKVEKTGQYILQIGVFNDERTAGQARISLLLAGFEADLVQTTEGNRTLYRLQKGPYTALAQVKKMQKQLQSKGTPGIIKQL